MPPDPSSVSWFVDENNLFLARRLAEHTSDPVFYPGHAGLAAVPRGTTDEQWLTVIGALGLVVITRDTRIRYRPAEKLQWLQAGVRGFVLTAGGNLKIAEQIEIIENHWQLMRRHAVEEPDGPWLYSITRAGLRRILPAA